MQWDTSRVKAYLNTVQSFFSIHFTQCDTTTQSSLTHKPETCVCQIYEMHLISYTLLSGHCDCVTYTIDTSGMSVGSWQQSQLQDGGIVWVSETWERQTKVFKGKSVHWAAAERGTCSLANRAANRASSRGVLLMANSRCHLFMSLLISWNPSPWGSISLSFNPFTLWSDTSEACWLCYVCTFASQQPEIKKNKQKKTHDKQQQDIMQLRAPRLFRKWHWLRILQRNRITFKQGPLLVCRKWTLMDVEPHFILAGVLFFCWVECLLDKWSCHNAWRGNRELTNHQNCLLPAV